MLLLNKRKASAKELGEYFDVSERTIQRDIDSISAAGIPVYGSRGKEGGYSILDTYKVDKYFLTDSETDLLLNLLKGFKKGYDTLEIKNIIGKITGIGSQTGNNNNLYIDHSYWGQHSRLKGMISGFEKAISDANIVLIEYASPDSSRKEREIEPHKLVFKSYNWYIYGYCRLKSDFRLFKLSRILGSTFTKKKFTKKEIPENVIEESSWNHLKNVKYKLKFNSESAPKVVEYFDVSGGEKLSDGSVIVEAVFPESEWVYNMILSYGANVEVLEPAHARDEVRRRVRLLFDVYN
jgi:predicted DNA-binding transcriptional regulator YafY